MNSRFGALVSRMRTQRALSTLVILLTLTVGILIGTVLSRGKVRGYSGPDGSLLPAMQSPQQLSNTFGQVATAIEPAVVNVSTESTPKVRRRGSACPTADSATMAAMIHSRIFLIASLAGNKAGRVDKVVQAVMTMIKARRTRLAVPEAAVDASVRSVQA